MYIDNGEPRTIMHLLNGYTRVYVYLCDKEEMRIFLEMADKEGFTLSRGRSVLELDPDGIMAICGDHTICHIGYVGHAAWNSMPNVTEKNLYHVDFKRYRTGQDNIFMEEYTQR